MPNKQTRILILDDDESIALTLQFMLERIGYSVLYTVDQRQFFELVKDWQPTFVFIDLVMPNMDGVEVIAQLASLETKSKIVISSGAHPRVLDAAKLSAIEHGLSIAGVLSKPFKSEALRKLLEASVSGEDSTDDLGSDKGTSNLTADDLALALENDEINIVLQPKVYCANDALAGFEVLARWNHALLGPISPDLFIVLAEKNGLIDKLSEKVIAKSLNWLSKLPERIEGGEELAGLATQLDNLVLSINISARSLTNKELFLEIGRLCDVYSIRTNRIILEITETSAMDNPLASLDILTRLRVQGFMLSIDDFGTGYSSMKQLVRLPFSEIKVDKSFVMSAQTNAESMTIVRSVIELGRSLGLSTTAEGIENKDTLQLVKAMGCELGQGYFIAKPLALGEVDDWIVAHSLKCEKIRLADLEQLKLLDTAPEERFDRHTRYAQQYFNVPYSVVSLVAQDRQWFKSNAGFPANGSARSEAFCAHAITSRDIFEVPDATKHPIFAQFKSVRHSPKIRYYAGFPLKGTKGQHIGTLCILDTKPNKLSAEQSDKFRTLAKVVEAELRLTISATIDKETGVLNRQGLDVRSKELLLYAYRLTLPVAEIKVTIDNIEKISEEYGESAGRESMQAIAASLQQIVRRSDIVGRYEQDSFKLYLLDIPEERVRTVIARIEESVENFNTNSASFRIQLSCDVSSALTFDEFAQSMD